MVDHLVKQFVKNEVDDSGEDGENGDAETPLADEDAGSVPNSSGQEESVRSSRF